MPEIQAMAAFVGDASCNAAGYPLLTGLRVASALTSLVYDTSRAYQPLTFNFPSLLHTICRLIINNVFYRGILLLMYRSPPSHGRLVRGCRTTGTAHT